MPTPKSANKSTASKTTKPKRITKPRKTFDYGKVQALASTGAKAANIARALGCCETTIYHRLNDDPEFKEAYARGRAISETRYAHLLEELAFTTDVDAATRLKAAMFVLERVHGWYKTTELKAEVEANTVVEVKDIKELSDDELEAQISKLDAGGINSQG